MERDRRHVGKAAAGNSPVTSDGLAVSAQVVAPLGAFPHNPWPATPSHSCLIAFPGSPSWTDVSIFVTKGWAPICPTLLKLSLRGIPFMQIAELADLFCNTLGTSTRLTSLDLTSTRGCLQL